MCHEIIMNVCFFTFPNSDLRGPTDTLVLEYLHKITYQHLAYKQYIIGSRKKCFAQDDKQCLELEGVRVEHLSRSLEGEKSSLLKQLDQSRKRSKELRMTHDTKGAKVVSGCGQCM